MDSELTPDNINETLTILPESTGETPDTGDAFDADGEPLDAALTLDDIYDAEGEPVAAEAPQEEVAAPEAPAAELAELEELRRARAERDQWQQWYVQQQAAAQQAQVDQAWRQSYEQGMAYFANREQEMLAQAREAYDPVGFIEEQRQAIAQEYAQWTTEYQSRAQQHQWQQYAASQVPAYAQHVASHYGLDQNAAQELMRIPPDYMPREAARMARERHLLRQIDQINRSTAAQRVASHSVAPGGGRAAGGRIRAGSRGHLIALLTRQP